VTTVITLTTMAISNKLESENYDGV